MKIVIEVPDEAFECEHKFNAKSLRCKCGLHMSLSEFVARAKAENELILSNKHSPTE